MPRKITPSHDSPALGGDKLATTGSKPPNSLAPSARKSRAIVSLYSSQRLQDDGSPNPLLVGRNKIEMGFTCPQREYIESLNCPSISFLSTKWNIGAGVIETWLASQDWGGRRAREWQRVEQMAFEQTKEQLALIRAGEQSRQRDDLMTLRDLVKEKLRDGTVLETTPLGEIIERPLSVKELKDISATTILLGQAINETLGIQKNLGRLDETSLDENGPKVRRVTHKYAEIVEEYQTQAPQLRQGNLIDVLSVEQVDAIHSLMAPPQSEQIEKKPESI